MNRKAVVIRESRDGKRRIAVDSENAEELLNFFQKNKRYRKKFDHICELILGGHKNRELYDKEEPNGRCKGVRAMKFFKGQENAGVYCKELVLEDHDCIIVAAEILTRKKQTKLSYKEINLIERVASYEYSEIQ